MDSRYGIGGNPQQQEEMVCPQCGLTLENGESYCMTCGMSVKPMSKRDYNLTKKTGYNSKPNPVPIAPAGNVRSSFAIGLSGTAIRRIILLIILFVLAGVAVWQYIAKANELHEDMLTRTSVMTSEGAEMAKIEKIIVKGRGKKVTDISKSVSIDVSGVEQWIADQMVNEFQKEYEALMADMYCLTFSVKQDGDFVRLSCDYRELDKGSNVQKMIDHGLLEIQKTDDLAENKYILDYDTYTSRLTGSGYRR